MTALPQFASARIMPSATGMLARDSGHLVIFSGPWHALTPFSAINWYAVMSVAPPLCPQSTTFLTPSTLRKYSTDNLASGRMSFRPPPEFFVQSTV